MTAQQLAHALLSLPEDVQRLPVICDECGEAIPILHAMKGITTEGDNAVELTGWMPDSDPKLYF